MHTSEHHQPNSYLPTDIDFTKVTIASFALRKGKPVVKTLNARRTQLMNVGSDSYRFYALDKTNRDFQRWRFPLEPGCIIDDETGSYEVLSVNNLTRCPKIPFFYTKRIASKVTIIKEDIQ